MLEKKLAQAFVLSNEDHGEMFERFANAFSLDDFPELEGVGAENDKGMDARLAQESGKNILVVQSCVSPANSARTKVLATLSKLTQNQNLPETLIYCSPANIGLKLDETKNQLRKANVALF